MKRGRALLGEERHPTVRGVLMDTVLQRGRAQLGADFSAGFDIRTTRHLLLQRGLWQMPKDLTGSKNTQTNTSSQPFKRCLVERMRNLKINVAFPKKTVILHDSYSNRRRGRVVQCSGLIIRNSVRAVGGSNPSASAHRLRKYDIK